MAGIYVDLAVKGNTKTVQKFQRRLINPDETLIESFPRLACGLLTEIGESTVATPSLPFEEQLEQFPMTGMFNGSCERCAMQPLCWSPGREEATLGGFRPRQRRPDEPITTETPT